MSCILLSRAYALSRSCARSSRDYAEIEPRSCRDHAEIVTRSSRDRAEVTPRSRRDRAEIVPRSRRDRAEIVPRLGGLGGRAMGRRRQVWACGEAQAAAGLAAQYKVHPGSYPGSYLGDISAISRTCVTSLSVFCSGAFTFTELVHGVDDGGTTMQ